jgi:hypothetical protein
VAGQAGHVQQTATGLCGCIRKAKSELQWTPFWEFAQTIRDMVQAELESRSEIERADPLVPVPSLIETR